MATLVTDQYIEEQIRAQRAESGADRFDEVWDGTNYILPLRDVQHQRIVSDIASITCELIDWTWLGAVYAGACVSDRETGWEENYRFPDLVVVLNGSRAKNCATHFCGGPDFLAEVVTPHDHTREKLPFYGRIGVRELLIVDREPWCLDLYQLHGEALKLSAQSRVDVPTQLTSAIMPLSFRLIPGKSRPRIEVTHRDGVQRWVV